MSKPIIPTFDEAIDSFENGGEKATKRAETKLAKYTQLATQKSNFEITIMKQTARLNKSYFDPSIDSVQAKHDLDLLNKDLQTCTEIMTSLFPNGIQ